MDIRSYRRRGTPDFPVAMYPGTAGANMKKRPNTEYHPEPEISLMADGDMTMQIAGVSKTFRKGDIFIIPPNTVHRRGHFSDDALVRTIVFSVDAIRLPPEHFFQKEFVQPLSEGRLSMPTLLQPGHPAYDSIFSQMQQIEHCRLYDKDYKQKRFYILIGVCLALMPYCHVSSEERPVLDPGNEAVKQCLRYIHNHYREKLRLEDMAAECLLHPNYLCAIFKQYTGETVFEYLHRFRIETAAGLLRSEDLPAGKVAELVGFRTECQFYKKFRQFMGTTPKAYARQLQASKKADRSNGHAR